VGLEVKVELNRGEEVEVDSEPRAELETVTHEVARVE